MSGEFVEEWLSVQQSLDVAAGNHGRLGRVAKDQRNIFDQLLESITIGQWLDYRGDALLQFARVLSTHDCHGNRIRQLDMLARDLCQTDCDIDFGRIHHNLVNSGLSVSLRASAKDSRRLVTSASERRAPQ